MKTTAEILNLVTDEAAMQALGVKADRIRMARKDERLPASWLDALEKIAGHPLPRELFTFKGQSL